jgi:CHASE3 domain sensor protein
MPRLNSRSRGFALGATVALMVKGPIFAAALAWTSEAVHGLDSTQGWVQHSQAVIAEADNMLTALSDAERGQRDFLLSNDTRMLEPYQAAILRVGASVNALGRLTAGEERRAVPLEKLWQVADDRLEDLAAKVQARQEAGSATLTVEEIGRGQRLMQEARNTVAAFRASEMRSLDQRLQAAGHEAKRALASLAAAGAVALGLLLIGAVAYRRRSAQAIDLSQIRLTLAKAGP